MDEIFQSAAPAPSARQPVGVIHVARNPLAGKIDARAHLLPAAEEAAQIRGAIRRSALIGGKVERPAPLPAAW